MTQYSWIKGEEFGGSSRPLNALEHQETRCAAGLFSWHLIRHEDHHERGSETNTTCTILDRETQTYVAGSVES